jgi:hypothetical protein
MIETIYRDLSEFGLPLLTPESSDYPARFEEIRNRPMQVGPVIDGIPVRAAILENRTGRAVIILSYVWRYTTATGQTRTTRRSNLGSSRQMDILMGREKAVRDVSSFILPGSRRLITEDGIFGDNSDVLARQPTTGGGWGRGTGGRETEEPIGIVRIVLELDAVILEDGLCLGPDESRLRESLIEQMATQANTAREIAEVLRAGATPGRIFEMLRPLAIHRAVRATQSDKAPRGIPVHFLSMFARVAIDNLINADNAEFADWVEAAAASSPLRLHPPED